MDKSAVTFKGGVGRSIRIVTWKVFSHLKILSSDIVFLQEKHLRISGHTRLRKPWVGQVYHSSFNSRLRGTAILIHMRVTLLMEQVISDPEGRFVIVSGVLFQKPVILVNVYVEVFSFIDESNRLCGPLMLLPSI